MSDDLCFVRFLFCAVAEALVNSFCFLTQLLLSFLLFCFWLLFIYIIWYKCLPVSLETQAT